MARATFLVTITLAPRPHTSARATCPTAVGGLETYGVDDLHYPEDVLLGDGAAEPHAGQGQFAALHQYAGGDIALGVGELLADIGVSLGTGGTLDGVHRVPLIFGCDLTAVGADNTGKTPRHCTLTSKSPDCSSTAARMGS